MPLNPIDSFYTAIDEHVESVDVIVGGDVKVRVFPVRFGESVAFTEQIGVTVRAVLAELGNLPRAQLAGKLPVIVRIVMSQLAALVETSLTAWRGAAWQGPDAVTYEGHPSLARLPVDVAALVTVQWLRLSFAPEKLRPLAGIVEVLVSQATGKKLDLWTMLKSFWSGLGTDSPTSTGGDAPAGPTEGSASGTPAAAPAPSTT